MKKIYVLFGLLSVMILFSGIASAVAPVLSNEVPTDGSTQLAITITSVNVTMFDADSDINWTIDFSPDIGNSSETLGKNGSKTCTISGLLYGTTYTWTVSAMDCNGSVYTNATYTFTTRSEQRLSEHFTDPVKLVLIGLISLFLILGLVMYCIKTFRDKTFKVETFFTLFFAVVVTIVVMGFI